MVFVVVYIVGILNYHEINFLKTYNFFYHYYYAALANGDRVGLVPVVQCAGVGVDTHVAQTVVVESVVVLAGRHDAVHNAVRTLGDARTFDL